MGGRGAGADVSAVNHRLHTDIASGPGLQTLVAGRDRRIRPSVTISAPSNARGAESISRSVSTPSRRTVSHAESGAGPPHASQRPLTDTPPPPAGASRARRG